MMGVAGVEVGVVAVSAAIGVESGMVLMVSLNGFFKCAAFAIDLTLLINIKGYPVDLVRKTIFSSARHWISRCIAVCVQNASIVAATALILVTGATFPASAKEATKEPITSTERIMVFGDSLSAAYGLNPAEGWVSLMETALKNRGISVVNASISGETTRGGLNRIQGDLQRQKPTIVLIALGANDALRGLPVADTKKNLDAIITTVRAAKARPVIIGIQIPPNYGLEYTQSFSNVFPTLARQYKLPLVPFLLEGIAEKLELFQADRLHPIAAAQPRILANVMPAVEQALKIKTTDVVATAKRK
jgi:acyl-CoA thioesterase I